MEQDEENVSRNYSNLSDFQTNSLPCMLSTGGYRYQSDIPVPLKLWWPLEPKVLLIQFLAHLNPEPKVQVSLSNHLLSIVCPSVSPSIWL